MSIAAINAVVLSDTEELANLETQRTMIDANRQMLSIQSSTLYTELQEEMQKAVSSTDTEANSDDAVEEYNSDQFQVELQAAINAIEQQDKVLEMQRNQMNTKIDQLTTRKESAEKMLEKNVERDMKGFNN